MMRACRAAGSQPWASSASADCRSLASSWVRVGGVDVMREVYPMRRMGATDFVVVSYFYFRWTEAARDG